MRSKSISAAWLTMLAIPLAADAQPVTSKSRQRHGAIAEIKAIYREVRLAQTTGRLRKEQRTFGDCRSYEDGERTLYLDRAGRARSYRTVRGSEDSVASSSYYYDRSGALRFVLVQAGAVNGTTVEYRIYLSTAGERLWEERRQLQGPGWTFPSQIPEDWLVRDPALAFRAEHPCAEVR